MNELDHVWLSAYLDGELDPVEAGEIEARLAAEPELARVLEELRATAELVGEAEAPPMPSAEAWDAFQSDLEEELGERVVQPATRPESLVWRLTLLAASVLLCATLIGRLGDPPVSLAAQRHPSSSERLEEPVWSARQPIESTPLERVIDAGLARLSSEARTQLADEGLVQTRAGAERSALAQALPGPGEPRLLATADLSLLLFHAVSGRAALTLERAVVRPLLREELELLCRELARLEAEAGSQAIAAAARRAHERFAVAARLVGVDPRLAEDSAERVAQEIAHIEAADRKRFSEVLDRAFDYRVFRARGLHANEGVDHARAVTWLSRTGFRLDPEEHSEELRAACLTSLALASGRLGGGRRGLWAQGRVEAAVELLFGEPDELTPFDVIAAIRTGLGRYSVRPSELASGTALERVGLELRARAASRVAAQAPGQVRSLEGGLRLVLLGATRSLEARVFSALTGPSLEGRPLPHGLDLAALLGSRRARTALSALGLDAPGYDAALIPLQAPAQRWVSPRHPVSLRASLERARLSAVASLVDEDPPAGRLPSQGSASYRDRLLMAGLAALNGAGPCPEVLPPELGAQSSRPAVPLLEPLPRLHARLAFACERLARALEAIAPERTLLSVRLLRRVGRLEAALRDASVELLEGRALTPAAADELRMLRPLVEALVPKRPTSAEDVYELGRDNGLKVLHRAVTRVDRLYLVTLDPETLAPRLGCGPALVSHEFTTRGFRVSQRDLDQRPLADPIWASHLERTGP